jgi:CRISPR-associated endonuclease/helicase Cas3
VLDASDFTPFTRELHGRDPFPWQQGLVDRILADGEWPDLIDVPTGLGKTSTLDIAVFVAAATAAQDGSGRLGRRRVLFVVDRRIVVDEATTHAERLATALQQALGEDGAVGEVVRQLRTYAPEAAGDVLTVTRMRGGVTWDAEWIDRPDRPAVVIGTVDQVGSRFLFRGYGISDRRKPIDAALVGTDALLLVDEAHLASALTTTVAAAGARDELRLPLPGLRVVQLTATPGVRRGSRYDFDVAAHLGSDQGAPPSESVQEASRRLTAAKDLFLIEVRPKDMVKRVAEAAERLALRGGSDAGSWPPVVLAVCNTVDRARAVHSLLAARSTGRDGQPRLDVDLLIGRARPADRAGLERRILDRFGIGREPGPRAAVLVATQTVEVGINLDVDGLVTECASWDSLVQRLGRVNRLGRYPRDDSGSAAARAIVVHDGGPDSPVYGPATRVTWSHLAGLRDPIGALSELDDPSSSRLDVSPLACRALLPGAGPESFPVEALGVPPETPILQTPTLDTWVCTGPMPIVDPPVAPFLHGFTNSSPAVQVAWRDGLTEPNALDDPFATEDELPADVPRAAAAANALLTAMPIRSAERAEIPLHIFRSWVNGERPPAVSDLESAPDEPEPRPRTHPEPFRVLAWRSGGTGSGAASGSWDWIDGDGIRPGDQIVVPTARGGLDEYGWNPASTSWVVDATEAAAFRPSGPRQRGRGRPVLRIDPQLPARLGLQEPGRSAVAAAVGALYSADQADASLTDRRDALVEELLPALAAAEEDLPAPIGVAATTLARWLQSSPPPRLVEVTEPGREIVVGGEVSPPVLLYLLAGGHLPPAHDGPATEVNLAAGDDRLVSPAEGDDEDPVASSVGSGRVTLHQHHTRVRERAAEIARALCLDAELAATVAAAAGWHDVGKVEERFQAMLHGGDGHEAMIAVEPLAKSGLPSEDRASWRQARIRSGLPSGARHEAWSAALVKAYLADREQPWPGDTALVLHLIAAHHGHARPLLPPVVDTDPREIKATVDGSAVAVGSERTVDLAEPARFAALNARYGRWGLALLEAVVRCADTTVSAEGS